MEIFGIKIFEKEKHFSKLSQEELIIRWGDLIVLNADHLGCLDIRSFWHPLMLISLTMPSKEKIESWRKDEGHKIRDMIILRLGDVKGQVDIITNELTKYMEAVKKHLLSNRYIKAQIAGEDFWRLDERGEIMRELGGHNKYQKHRKREINIIENQAKTTNLLILATILAAIMPFVAEQCNNKREEIKNEIKVVVPDSFYQQMQNQTRLLQQIQSEKEAENNSSHIKSSPTPTQSTKDKHPKRVVQ